jgi:hypothetical protein
MIIICEGIGENTMSFLAWLLFWKYYREEDSSNKDLKLVKVRANLIISNGFLFILLAFLASVGGIFKGIAISLIFCMFIQFIFQNKITYKAWKRVNGITSLRKELKEVFGEFAILSSALVAGLANGLVDEFMKIIDEFYGNYQEKEKGYKYYKEQSYKNETKYNANHDEESVEVKRIFKKYNVYPNSDLKIIKKHFRSLAKKYHPDMPTGDEKLFMELREDLEYLMQYFKRNVSA